MLGRIALPKLPRFQDESQKKAFGNILKFMALVLVFTLIARGATGVTLAKVDTIVPYPAEIVESVSANGNLQAASSLPITAPAGLTIKEVLVAPGQAVSAGDAIVRFAPEEIAEGRRRAQLALDEMNLNLEQLERGEPHDGSALASAQNALAWAEQDYANTQAAGNAAIAAAQAVLADAQNTLNALRESAAAAAALPPADAGADPENPGDSAEPLAPSGPSAADITAAEAAVSAAQTALDNAARDADMALQGAARAIETARLGLASTQLTDSAARQTAADVAAQNALDAEALRLDIEVQQAAVLAYEAIESGTVTARADGVVLDVMNTGIVTEGGAIAHISDADGGYLVTASILGTEADKLQIGAQVHVTAAQGTGERELSATGTVLSLSASQGAERSEVSLAGESRVEMTVRLPHGEWTHGQSVNLEAVFSRQKYYSCVPLLALGQGANGYFVYVMEEHSGVLGVENVARRVPATLLASDASVAAIEGDISGGQRVISGTSKPLADGDKLRVRQP